MDSQCNSSGTIFGIHGISDFLHFFLTCFKHIFVMVTDNVGKGSCGNITGHICQMVKTFSAFCVGWCFHRRQQGLDLACNESSIDHDIFCFSRVNIHTFHRKDSACSIKVFIGDFTFMISIYRISKICVKIIKIEQICTASDFLVRCKADPDIAVWNIRGDELFDSGHDFRNSGFIVCTKQSCTVCCDQGFAF